MDTTDPHNPSIWLTDLRPGLPITVRLDGCSMYFDAAAPQEDLLPNGIPRHFDAKGEVPAGLVGCFDVVHIWNFVHIFLIQTSLG